MALTSAIAAVAGTGYSIYSGERAQRAQEDAMRKQEAEAQKQETAADIASNRSNRKTPNLAAIMKNNKGGAGSTMLTGPQGVDPGALTLGRNTLLGA